MGIKKKSDEFQQWMTQDRWMYVFWAVCLFVAFVWGH